MDSTYRISIERLENAFEITVPDWSAIERAEAAAKKKRKDDPSDCGPYIGDLTKSYACGSVAEAVKIIEKALRGIPEQDFASAFAEASADMEDD